MIISNKIQQTFNGPLIFIGITFLLIAIILVIVNNWFVGILSFVVASFLLFTWSGIEIDTDKRRIKPFYMLFGLIQNGKWDSLDSFIGLTLVPMQKVYSVFSRSNRQNISVYDDFRVYLVGKNKKPALPLVSSKSMAEAQKKLNEFNTLLNLPILKTRKYS